ncbi:MAG: metal-dependent transcriptional regulator [Kiritimatiellae bacterium]|nr:metal-dependent transcriptional regulator [Kiritimatiellia bacterium]
MTQSLEDYLEAIHRLLVEGKRARVRDVAAMIGVKMPSVNRAMAELKLRGLVVQEPYRDLELTAAGKMAAEAVFARHRLLTAFLERIGVPVPTAEHDACIMEHILSPETLQCIRRFLDDPPSAPPVH